MVDALKNSDQVPSPAIQLRVLYNASRVFWQFHLVEQCVNVLKDLIDLLERISETPESIGEGLSLNQVTETLFVAVRARARISKLQVDGMSDSFYFRGLKRFLSDRANSLTWLEKVW